MSISANLRRCRQGIIPILIWRCFFDGHTVALTKTTPAPTIRGLSTCAGNEQITDY